MKRILDLIVGLLGILLCSWHFLYRRIRKDGITAETCMTKGGKPFQRYRYQKSGSCIPSLLNLVNGTMSLVGPSVVLYSRAKRELEEDSRYFYRYRLKPGMISYAGLHSTEDTDALNTLKMDLYYVQHFSLLNDFKLILQAIRIY